ncbi:hypothetical protein FKP32DRAFT_1606041 [Trametes sanguinea]|nr:hypothetical protein FKP32DRAFT_1606041 [Trametes sanguinea]
MVRVRARPEQFDETNAVSLSPFSRVEMRFSNEHDDGMKMCANLDALNATTAASPTTVDIPRASSPASSRPHTPEPAVGGTAPDLDPQQTPPRNVPVQYGYSENTPTSSGSCSTSSLEYDEYDEYSDYSGDDRPIDPFSAPDEDVELVPLVDLWVSELADHLKQEDIPHPSELTAEVEQLTGFFANGEAKT